MDWKQKNVVVTGGASFIGSHLMWALLRRGADRVTVIDNFSSGRREYVKQMPDAVGLVERDLAQFSLPELKEILAPAHCVFHLAADHGGRGYVQTQQAACATNLHLDGLVFRACAEVGVKVVYASSGCVYPSFLQGEPDRECYLTENMVGPPYDADNTYGWAKLMGEKTLQAYHKDRGLKSTSCRYFTVYGPRGKVDHAVMAMLARARVRQDPFEVWGDGTQVRNWTYVEDIVEGTILAAERVDDGSAINLGTMERVRVIDAARMAAGLAGYRPEFKLLPDMPTGPLNRVADNSLAKRLLGWEPKTTFAEGLARTYAWLCDAKGEEIVRQELATQLMAR